MGDQLGQAGEAMGDAQGQLARAIPTGRSTRKVARSRRCLAAVPRIWRSRCSSRA